MRRLRKFVGNRYAINKSIKFWEFRLFTRPRHQKKKYILSYILYSVFKTYQSLTRFLHEMLCHKLTVVIALILAAVLTQGIVDTFAISSK